MNPFIIIGLAVGAGLLFNQLSKKNFSVENLSYNISKIRFGKKTTLQNIELIFDITIFNPTSEKLFFKELIADVIYNSIKVGKIILQKDNISIPANDNVVIKDVSFLINNKDVLAELFQVFKKGYEAGKNIQLKGYIKINTFAIPINESIEIMS